jgi:dienelactone hydrolase
MVRKILLTILFSLTVLMSVACFSRVKFEGTSLSVRSEQFTLTGKLSRPNGEGPFPAVVLLHGCSGSHSREDIWAGRLRRLGYVALQVDSLGPRGKSNICGKPYAVPPWMRAQDAYDAKSYLATLPFVDGNRIAVMGWSHGGNSTLETAKRNLIEEKPFSAAIAFYPYCGHYKWSYFNAPLLILVGEKDDWTPAYLCTSALPPEGTTTHELTLKIYPGSYHTFDMRVKPRVYLGHHLEYNRAAEADAIVRVKEFLAKYLH